MFDIINPLTNKVVNIILVIIINILKVTLLRNDRNKQESLIFESVAAIRIKFKHCKGNHLTTRHAWVTKTPWVTTIYDDYQGVKPGPPYPSACIPRDTSMGIRGCPTHYPNVHPGGMVGYRPTQRPSKLQSLWDPINPVYMCVST
jgi:hypothetical protein